jgi:hypothetical protein
MQIFDHNIGFWDKRQFFRRKLAKIAQNCDHNIDSWWYTSHQEYQFGYILEGFWMENVGIIYCHLKNSMALWNILATLKK